MGHPSNFQTLNPFLSMELSYGEVGTRQWPGRPRNGTNSPTSPAAHLGITQGMSGHATTKSTSLLAGLPVPVSKESGWWDGKVQPWGGQWG